MAYGKWIGSFLGFINTHSALGAIAGFVLGAIFDAISERKNRTDKESSSIKNVYASSSLEEGNRNSFLFSLMVLSAHIIQADGKIMHSEMEQVRKFLRISFGEISVSQGNEILLRFFEYRKLKGEYIWQSQIRSSCEEMSSVMPEEHKIQLITFLAEIAKADGEVHTLELKALKEIALNLGLEESMVDQMLALGGKSLEDAYKVLGVTEKSTNDEIQRAYRQMVIKHHPDRVANLGDDIKEAATRKLQDINNAKEIIYKARHIK